MVPFFTTPLGCDGSQKLFDGSVNQDLAIVKHTFLLQPIIGLQPISYKIMLFHNTIFNMHHPHSYVLQYIIIYVSEYHACNKGSEPSQVTWFLIVIIAYSIWTQLVAKVMNEWLNEQILRDFERFIFL